MDFLASINFSITPSGTKESGPIKDSEMDVILGVDQTGPFWPDRPVESLGAEGPTKNLVQAVQAITT